MSISYAEFADEIRYELRGSLRVNPVVNERNVEHFYEAWKEVTLRFAGQPEKLTIRRDYRDWLEEIHSLVTKVRTYRATSDELAVQWSILHGVHFSGAKSLRVFDELMVPIPTTLAAFMSEETALREVPRIHLAKTFVRYRKPVLHMTFEWYAWEVMSKGLMG